MASDFAKFGRTLWGGPFGLATQAGTQEVVNYTFEIDSAFHIDSQMATSFHPVFHAEYFVATR